MMVPSKISGFVTVFCLVCLISSARPVHAGGKVGILTESEPSQEMADLVKWSRLNGYDAAFVITKVPGTYRLPTSDVLIDLSDFSLLWLDVPKPDDGGKMLSLDPVWSSSVGKNALLKYVKAGGVLVVSGTAMRYPADLGIETILPNDCGSSKGSFVGDLVGVEADDVTVGFPDVTRAIDGARDYRWVRYSGGVRPANGNVLMLLKSNGSESEVVGLARWNVGKGRIYGIGFVPWIGELNKARKGLVRLVAGLYRAAGVKSSEEIARGVSAETTASHGTTIHDLKLSDIARSASVGKRVDKSPYARLTDEGFVVGNSYLERRLVVGPTIKTSSVWNKLSGEAIPVGSSEFRLILGRKRREHSLGPEDFNVIGKPLVKGTSAEVVLERKMPPRLRVDLVYSATGKPHIEKSLKVTNIGDDEVFLREVWLDAMHFGPLVKVVPYPVFAAFARSSKGSFWVCQSLPYSLPQASASARWIAVAYPPCEALPAGGSYLSETSYLSAVKFTGRMNEPCRIKHQFTPYGPFRDPDVALDLGEVDSCLEWIDSHATQVRNAYIYPIRYLFHGNNSSTDWLPNVTGPGAGWNSIKRWIDGAKSWGISTYDLYPDLGAFITVPEADKLLIEKIVPYLKPLDMDLITWFSTYDKSWFGGVGLVDGEVKTTYSDPHAEQWMVKTLSEAIRKWNLSGIMPDQANYRIDSAYDIDYGYPGRLPMSPWLYRELKAWEYIIKELMKARPDLIWGGNGHFGNNHAPLSAGVVTLHYWCEPEYTRKEYAGRRDRHPAMSPYKAVADGYRREQYWMRTERFVPYRLMTSNLSFHFGWGEEEKPTGEPISQMLRYMLMQSLALHPNFASLIDLTHKDYFSEQDKAFARKWFDFTRKHVNELSNRPYTPEGEPRYGVVEVYSYGNRGNGWVFLVNPGHLRSRGRFRVDKSTGFVSRCGYAVRELSPYERWRLIEGKPSVRYGQKIEVEVPGYTVMLLQLTDVKKAWKGLKEISIGAELAKGGTVLASPGESLEYGVYDVSNPSAPRRLRGVSGVAAGTSPRIEMTHWRVRPGNGDEKFRSGFEGGELASFGGNTSPSEEFTIADFGGVALWDMGTDPVFDRVAVKPSKQDKPSAEATLEKPARDLAVAESYWLAADCNLQNLPRKPQIVLQMLVPERAEVKMWINGKEQECQRLFNDWCVLAPIGLRAGDNSVSVWIGRQRN